MVTIHSNTLLLYLFDRTLVVHIQRPTGDCDDDRQDTARVLRFFFFSSIPSSRPFVFLNDERSCNSNQYETGFFIFHVSYSLLLLVVSRSGRKYDLFEPRLIIAPSILYELIMFVDINV